MGYCYLDRTTGILYEWSEPFWIALDLKEHNMQRLSLGLAAVGRLPEIDELRRVFDEYQLWLYRPGGDIYLTCKNTVEN